MTYPNTNHSIDDEKEEIDMRIKIIDKEIEILIKLEFRL